MPEYDVMIEFAITKNVTVKANDETEASRKAVDYAERCWPQEGIWEAIDCEELNDKQD